jgi:hypothetical protein
MPPFQPGHPKFGGRKKGVKTARQLEAEALELEAIGKSETTGKPLLDIFEDIARDKSYKLSTRFEAAKIVMPYRYPRLVSQDIRAETSNIVYAIHDQPGDDSAWVEQYCRAGTVAERSANVDLQIERLRNEEYQREIDRLRDELAKTKESAALSARDPLKLIPLLE